MNMDAFAEYYKSYCLKCSETWHENIIEVFSASLLVCPVCLQYLNFVFPQLNFGVYTPQF